MKSLKVYYVPFAFLYLQINKPKLLNTRKSRRRSRNHAMCSWCVNMDFIHAQRFKCKMEVSCRENLSLFQLTCMDDLWRKSTNSFMKRWVLFAMHVSLIHSSHVHFLFISFYWSSTVIYLYIPSYSSFFSFLIAQYNTFFYSCYQHKLIHRHFPFPFPIFFLLLLIRFSLPIRSFDMTTSTH